MKALISQRQAKNRYSTFIDVLEAPYITFFEKLGIDLHVVSNFHVSIKHLTNDLDLIILTGGGNVPVSYYDQPDSGDVQEYRDKTEKRLIEYAIINGIPILGICRGMQFLNGYFGGKVSKLDNLKKRRTIGEDHPIIIGNETVYVNNYHNDGIFENNLASEFIPVGMDVENKVIEACYSKTNKVLGVQWHPERKFSDSNSYKVSEQLISSFYSNRGRLDESYHLSSRTGN